MKTLRLFIMRASGSPRIICGFPGVGKSSLFAAAKDGQKITDSDSSTFPKDDFPANYVAHIKRKLAEGYTVLCSTHQEVRNALAAENLNYLLVYPEHECKDEYLDRYRKRGSPEQFVAMMDNKWDDFIQGCLDDTHASHLRLGPGEFIPPQVITG